MVRRILQGRPPAPASVKVVARLTKTRTVKDKADLESDRVARLVDADVVWAYAQKMPILQIAEHLGLTRKTVYAALKRSGIEI